MDMSWLKAIAPTVATALVGPLGGLAVEILGPKLGIEGATTQKIQDVLTKGQLSGDQIAALKQAELELQAREKELGFKFEELVFKDRDSARQREMSVKDNTNKVLAFLVIGSFLAMVAATLFGWAKAETVLAGTLIGYLSAKAEQVLAYYFGTTAGSARKDAVIANSVPVQALMDAQKARKEDDDAVPR